MQKSFFVGIGPKKDILLGVYNVISRPGHPCSVVIFNLKWYFDTHFAFNKRSSCDLISRPYCGFDSLFRYKLNQCVRSQDPNRTMKAVVLLRMMDYHTSASLKFLQLYFEVKAKFMFISGFLEVRKIVTNNEVNVISRKLTKTCKKHWYSQVNLSDEVKYNTCVLNPT